MTEPAHTAPAVPKGVGVVPIPDPTTLTTEQLLREIASMEAVLGTRMAGHKELFEIRFDGMDKAIALLQVITDRQPADVDRKVTALQTLHEEKFSSIQTQFRERDVRGEQSARDSKVAVDAALQAAKEAVGEQNKSSALAIAKSETATMKQIDQMGLLINSTSGGLNDKIDDIKERLTRIEGEDRGQKTAKTTQETSNTSLVSIVGLVIGSLIGIGGVIVAVIGRVGT